MGSKGIHRRQLLFLHFILLLLSLKKEKVNGRQTVTWKGDKMKKSCRVHPYIVPSKHGQGRVDGHTRGYPLGETA